MERVLVVHHSEIVLKGMKRSYFEMKLADNIRQVLGRGVCLVRDENRLVLCNPSTSAVELLRKMFGVSHLGVGYRCSPEAGEISETALKVLDPPPPAVDIDVKRSYKQHPFTSQQLRRQLAEIVRTRLGVEVCKNEKKLYVEVTKSNAYLYVEKVRGFGGLPVGSSGNVLCLLSGGVDSATASVLLMRRGCRVDFLHFHSYRSSQEALEMKMKELVERLTLYGLRTRLYMADFTPFYRIVLESRTRLELLLFRKYMLETASKIVEHGGYRAVALGDSLAQTASQTIVNIAAVKTSADVPVFRPLIGMGKDEIIELAGRYGLLDAVQKQYKDCCSILARHPATSADWRSVEEKWVELGVEKAVDETLERVQVFGCTFKAGVFRLSQTGMVLS
ncbi:MAG: THUMP domain-containing protein [Candidatus Caldarchaeum sp.]